jgi:hypothetical protein
MKYGFKAEMLMRVRTNTRFDYKRRVSTTEPRITPAEKGHRQIVNPNQLLLTLAMINKASSNS